MFIKSEIIDDAKKSPLNNKLKKVVKSKVTKTGLVKRSNTVILKGLSEMIKGVTPIPENAAGLLKMPDTIVLEGLSETIKRASLNQNDKITVGKVTKSKKAEGLAKKTKRSGSKSITTIAKMPNITIKKLEKPASISEKHKHYSN